MRVCPAAWTDVRSFESEGLSCEATLTTRTTGGASTERARQRRGEGVGAGGCRTEDRGRVTQGKAGQSDFVIKSGYSGLQICKDVRTCAAAESARLRWSHSCASVLRASSRVWVYRSCRALVRVWTVGAKRGSLPAHCRSIATAVGSRDAWRSSTPRKKT